SLAGPSDLRMLCDGRWLRRSLCREDEGSQCDSGDGLPGANLAHTKPIAPARERLGPSKRVLGLACHNEYFGSARTDWTGIVPGAKGVSGAPPHLGGAARPTGQRRGLARSTWRLGRIIAV